MLTKQIGAEKSRQLNSFGMWQLMETVVPIYFDFNFVSPCPFFPAI